MPKEFLPAVLNSNASSTQVPVFGCVVRRSGLKSACSHAMGEVDLGIAPRLEQALQEAEMCPQRALDLDQVLFMDSARVNALLDASERARVDRARRALLRGPSHVDRFFALTDTADSLEIVDISPSEPPISALVESEGNDGRWLRGGNDR
jgi:anti-anti-sigma factor